MAAIASNTPQQGRRQRHANKNCEQDIPSVQRDARRDSRTKRGTAAPSLTVLELAAVEVEVDVSILLLASEGEAIVNR